MLGVRSVSPDSSRAVSPVPSCTPVTKCGAVSELEHEAHSPSSSVQGSASPYRPSKVKGRTQDSAEWSAGFVAKMGGLGLLASRFLLFPAEYTVSLEPLW